MTKAMDRLNAYIVVTYYTLMMVFGVLIKNPLHLGVIFVTGVVMAMLVAGVRPTLRTLGYSLIFAVLIIVINPLVSKEGMTKIVEIGSFYMTLESLVYGAVSALMLCSVFMWFVSFNVIMTGDKYIYVLGRWLPSFSLLISLTLRLIPELNRDYEEQKMSLKSMRMFSDKGLVNRIKLNAHALKGVVRRAIENSTIRADSMQARGYGVAHRSTYLRYVWRVKDTLFYVGTILLGGLVIAGHVLGHSFASYYPIINVKFDDTYTIVSLLILTLYALLPIVLEVVEVIGWKRYLSRTSL